MIKRMYCTGLGILILCFQPAFGQQPATENKSDEHAQVVQFGDLSGGAIAIAEHLNDTLSFTDPWVNERFQIISFNLSLKCNGNVVKYLENKNGNALTAEMKQAIQGLHPNCTIVFERITTRSQVKDATGRYTESQLGKVVLTLK